MQLTIKSGIVRINVTKPERAKLKAAHEVLASLARMHPAGNHAGKAIHAIEVVLADIAEDGTYQEQPDA